MLFPGSSNWSRQQGGHKRLSLACTAEQVLEVRRAGKASCCSPAPRDEAELLHLLDSQYFSQAAYHNAGLN